MKRGSDDNGHGSFDDSALLLVRERMQARTQLRAKDANAKLIFVAGLRQNRFCRDLDDMELDAIFEAAQFYKFDEGEPVCAQGEVGDLFFVLESGICEVRVNGMHINTLKSGDSFGGVALLHRTQRTAGISTQERCGIWGVEGDAFRAVLQEHARRRFDDNMKFLDGVGVFDCLTAKQKTQLCELAMMTETFEENSRVITQGEITTAMYIVKIGDVSMLSGGTVNSEGILMGGARQCRLQSGDWFGYRSMLYQEPSRLSVVTDTHCVFLTIPFKHLATAIGDDLVNFLEHSVVHHILRQSPFAGKFTVSARSRIVNAMEYTFFSPHSAIPDDVGLIAVIEGEVSGMLLERPVRLQRGDSAAPVGPLSNLLSASVQGLPRQLKAGSEGCRMAILTQSNLAKAFKELGMVEIRNAEGAMHHFELIFMMQKVPLFKELSDGQLDALASSVVLRKYAKYAKVITQGEVGHNFYVIHTGSVRVVQDGDFVRTLGKGTCFGERALILDDDIRAATVEVVSEEAELWSVDRMSFRLAITPAKLEDLRNRIKLQNRTVMLKALRHVRFLAAGTFGSVRLVEEMATRTKYALKRFKRTANHRVPTEGLAEVAMLNSITEGEQPFMLRIVRACETDRSFYILMEYIPGGTLRARLSDLGTTLCFAHAQFYAGCIVIALEALHMRNVIHRNVSPDSIMMDAFGYVKLTSFGHAKQLASMVARTYTVVGKPAYIAPEIIRGRGYGTEADLWSLGVTLYELVCGRLPFGDPQLCDASDPQEMYAEVLGGRLTFPEHYTDEVGQRLISGLLSRESNVRLGNRMHGWEEVKKDLFFLAHSSEDFFASLYAHAEPPPMVPKGGLYPDQQAMREQVTMSDAEDLGAEPALQQKIRALFKKFDLDNNGRISSVELRRVLRRLDPKGAFSEEVMNAILEGRELHSGGGFNRAEVEIDYEEFLSWILSGSGETLRKAMRLEVHE